MANNFPKRFYRKTKTGRVLKYPDKDVAFCRWCGTAFVKAKYKDFCADYCYNMSEQLPNLLSFNRKG